MNTATGFGAAATTAGMAIVMSGFLAAMRRRHIVVPAGYRAIGATPVVVTSGLRATGVNSFPGQVSSEGPAVHGTGMAKR